MARDPSKHLSENTLRNNVYDYDDKFIYVGLNAGVLGNFVRTQVAADGGTVGYAIHEAAPSSPFSSDKHFQEVGHILEATGGAGLAMCVLHSN